MKNVSVAEKAAPTPRRFSTLLVFFVLASALPLMALSVALVTLSALQAAPQVLDGLSGQPHAVPVGGGPGDRRTVAALAGSREPGLLRRRRPGSFLYEREAEASAPSVRPRPRVAPAQLHNFGLYRRRTARGWPTRSGRGGDPASAGDPVKPASPLILTLYWTPWRDRRP
jgi:hypothetical protein